MKKKKKKKKFLNWKTRICRTPQIDKPRFVITRGLLLNRETSFLIKDKSCSKMEDSHNRRTTLTGQNSNFYLFFFFWRNLFFFERCFLESGRRGLFSIESIIYIEKSFGFIEISKKQMYTIEVVNFEGWKHLNWNAV